MADQNCSLRCCGVIDGSVPGKFSRKTLKEFSNQCEQSGSDLFAVTCKDRPSDINCRKTLCTAKRALEKTMARRFSNRFRRRIATIQDSFAKLLGFLKPAQELRSQRMCPSCGLITPRAQPFCLECGKLLNVVQLAHKDAR
jgi:hypothetical protein